MAPSQAVRRPGKTVIVGHPKDFATLGATQGFSWAVPEFVDTPFGPAQITSGFYETAVPVGFADRYALDPIRRTRVRPEALVLSLALRGYSNVVAINGTAAIDRRFGVGDFVVPSDFIEFAGADAPNYYAHIPGGVFFRLNPPFCPVLRDLLLRAATAEGVAIHSDAVCGVTRDRLETSAEIRMYQLLGAQLLNMRIAREAVLCRQLELCFASLCFVLNSAEGTIETTDITFTALKRGFDQQSLDVVKAALIRRFLSPDLVSSLSCQCQKALADAKRAGILGKSLVDEVMGGKQCG